MLIIRAMDFDYKHTIGFQVQEIDAQGNIRAIGEPVIMKSVTSDGSVFHPTSTMTLRYEQAQTLIDDLWNSGLRPSENKYTSETFKATKAHLEDMRQLAFLKLGIEKP